MKQIIRSVTVGLLMTLVASAALANGPQPRKDYDNASFYQPELNASVAWMAQAHNTTVDAIEAEYSFFWQFPINFEPASLVIHFYGQSDSCAVLADDVNNIQGQCAAAE